MINDDESLLRKASQDLYTKNSTPPAKRSFMHDKKIDAPDSWLDSHSSVITSSPMSQKPKTISWFKNIFLVSLGFLIVALMVAGFSFLRGANSISSRNVEIAVTTRSFVDGGEQFPVTVTITNKNRTSLELATLVLSYPEGNQSNPEAVRRITRDIGTLSSGATRQESFDIVLFGEEGSQRLLQASLDFRVTGSNAVYTSTGDTPLVIRSTPVRLVADIPDSVIPNQETTMRFTISGNGTTTLSNTAFTIAYPTGFTFIQSNPAPSFDTSVWYLGDIPATGERIITITGTFTGVASELKTIQASVGIADARNERLLSTIYNSISEIIPLTNAFLTISTKVAGRTDSAIPVSATSSSSVEIEWENTLDTQINNAEIKVRLSGGAYDPARVQANSGFFDSATNTITWTRQQVPGLVSLAPGETGRTTFSLTPRSAISGSNPSIDIIVDIAGFNSSGERISATQVDVKKLILNSDLNLLSRTLYYSGPIANTGLVPPKVGQKTTYTIDWQVSNSRNRIINATVSTTLPLWVTWENVIVPNSESANLSYNTVTREIVWNVGEMVPGSLDAKTVSFKVGIVPTGGQVGSVVGLTGDVILTGRDDFTKNDISINRRSMTTQLINDTSTVGAQGQVQP
jgi:hypothetical protein